MADPEPSRDTARSILAALQSGADLPSRVLLRDESSGTGPLVNTRAAEKPQGSAGRYTIHGEIARGGVGVVLKSRDVLLGRDVAMKILRDEYAQNPSVIQRFVEEAQIGGQLQHPGIVPIYEMGLHPDSRPFFTMKLIKGRTLSSLLAERKSPSEDLRRYLGVFEAVCQTLAYAHARRVVHRDLKPSNVMVGTFGEALVVDWGLGKVLRSAESAGNQPSAPAGASIISVRAGPGAAHSVVGSVMGTPHYMPPEQAQGLVDILDERTDVFALGAILSEILTGLPPYQGTDLEVVLKARRAELAEVKARLEGCGADKVLIALCLRCLAPAMEARPRNAGVVAKEVSQYLASVEDRQTAGQLAAAQAAERVAQEKKARRLTVAIAAAVLVTFTAGAAGWVVFAVDRGEREGASARAAARALDEASLAQGKAASEGTPERWEEALSAARRAVAAAESAAADVDARARAAAALAAIETGARQAGDRVAAAGRWTRLLGRLDEIDVSSGLGEDFRAETAYAAAFAEYGLDLEAGTPEEAAARIRLTPAPMRVASALDGWAWEKKAWGFPDVRLRAIVTALDPDPVRTRIRDPRGPGELRKIAASADAKDLPFDTAMALGTAFYRRDAVEGAADVAAELQRRFPGEFEAHVLHADAVQAGGGSVTRAVVRDATVLAALRDGSVAAWTRLGAALAAHGEVADAEAALRRAIALDAATAPAHARLGDVLALRGDWDGALAAYRAAVVLDGGSIRAQLGAGRALCRKGRYAESLAALRLGFELGAKRPRWSDPAALRIETVEELASLAARLSDLNSGRAQPADARERLAYAQVLRDSGMFARAADAYAAYFAADAAAAKDFRSESRLDAACSAALAVPRTDGRPSALDETETTARRRQALDWLRADLDAWSQSFAEDPRLPAADVRRRFARWMLGPELAGVRDPSSFGEMPDADRAAWTALWSDVRGLLARARD